MSSEYAVTECASLDVLVKTIASPADAVTSSGAKRCPLAISTFGEPPPEQAPRATTVASARRTTLSRCICEKLRGQEAGRVHHHKTGNETGSADGGTEAVFGRKGRGHSPHDLSDRTCRDPERQC